MTVVSSLPSSGTIVQRPDNASVRQEYELWDKAHERMTDTPPSEGRHYIQHALNLLNLLKPVSEINSIAKAVVGCFEQMVLFEKDRCENDDRAAGVILAQAGMMRILLDVHDLTARQDNPSTLRAMIGLPQLLSEVQKDISICHNCIDAYYRSHGLVKLYRAKEWKEKLLEFIQVFEKHRVLLHQALSLQVASDVNNLVSKMDVLFGRLFAPREPWELNVTAKIRTITMAKGISWIDDLHIIQSLAIDTRDSSMDLQAHPFDIIENTKVGVQLSVLKEDLQLPLDSLCGRNAELFGLTFRLHTERLEKSILHSARFVITSLSGPYDRLEHEDLRSLWKEMVCVFRSFLPRKPGSDKRDKNWMSYVETKVFGIALLEYYLDLYSNGLYSTGGHDTGLWIPDFNPLYRPGSLKHPHAWTLMYLFRYADKIAGIIDSDKSGLIRISEANAFTSLIPDGWALPQWCAFLVEGQFHESSMYRKRVAHLMFKVLEMQPQVLPHNRYPSAEFMCAISARVLHYFILEPRGSKPDTPITPELRELIRKKMLEQDEKFRTQLRSINWTISNHSVVEALSDGRPLEMYIFPLLTVLMELMMDIHHLSLSKAIDFKEWLVPYTSFLSVREAAAGHVKLLKRKFKFVQKLFILSLIADACRWQNVLMTMALSVITTKATIKLIDLQIYHHGMWALFAKVLDAKDMSQYMLEGYEMQLAPVLKQDYNFYIDQAFLEEFPLPRFTGSLLSLKYCSWEYYKQGKDPADVPHDQPMTWNPIDDEVNKMDLLKLYQDLPQSDWHCDKCNKESGSSERSIECLECFDIDLCRQCYGLTPSEHNVSEHEFSHLMVSRSMWLHPLRKAWIKLRTHVVKMHLAEKIKTNTITTLPSVDRNVPEGGSEADGTCGSNDLSVIGVCARCAARIVDWNSQFYVCGEYSCAKEDIFVCNVCAWTNEFPEGFSHLWWHALLPFDSRNLDILDSNDKTEQPLSVVDGHALESISPPQNSSLLINMSPPPLQVPTDHNPQVMESMEKLKDKVTSLDVKMTQRMDLMEAKLVGVENKLDVVVAELRSLMDALLVTRS